MTTETTQRDKPAVTSLQDDVWLKILNGVKKELSEQSFKTWVEPVQPIDLKDGILTLQVPDKFYGDWLKEHYQDIIRVSACDVIGLKPEIRYLVCDVSFKPAGKPASSSERKPKQSSGEGASLNNKYRFDSFVVGPANRFAHAAVLAV